MAHGGYFMYQPFTASARAILVNWLMEVVNLCVCVGEHWFVIRATLNCCHAQTASEHGQLRQTLQVAVNLLDRFFSLTTQVPTDLIQPIATAALHIASKIEVRITTQVMRAHLRSCHQSRPIL